MAPLATLRGVPTLGTARFLELSFCPAHTTALYTRANSTHTIRVSQLQRLNRRCAHGHSGISPENATQFKFECWERVAGRERLGGTGWEGLAGRDLLGGACWERLAGRDLLGETGWDGLTARVKDATTEAAVPSRTRGFRWRLPLCRPQIKYAAHGTQHNGLSFYYEVPKLEPSILLFCQSLVGHTFDN